MHHFRIRDTPGVTRRLAVQAKRIFLLFFSCERGARHTRVPDAPDGTHGFLGDRDLGTMDPANKSSSPRTRLFEALRLARKATNRTS